MQMTTQDTHSPGLRYLDILSCQDTMLHRLDPRAKVLTSLIYIVAVISFDKYAVSALLPFCFFPVVMISLGNLPAAYLVKQLLIMAPLALFVGIANPFFDREIMLRAGPVALSGGWISCCSIFLRFALTALAALILIATTGFTKVCMVLDRLGLPRAFTVQLLFIYRYIFVLADEGSQMSKARALRSCGRRGMSISVFCSLTGHLLLRTVDRAQRIYMAMVSRGFRGEFRFKAPLSFGMREAAFTLGWSAFFIFFRMYSIPSFVGELIEGLLR